MRQESRWIPLVAIGAAAISGSGRKRDGIEGWVLVLGSREAAALRRLGGNPAEQPTISAESPARGDTWIATGPKVSPLAGLKAVGWPLTGGSRRRL